MTEENLSCSICSDIYSDPVVLSCSHSFCRDCLQEWWSKKQAQKCPLCNESHPSQHLPCNLVLKNLCQDFLLRRKQEEAEPLCSLHSEKLKLFCQDHQQLVCVVCRDSREHRRHRFTPANEAAQHYKQQLLQSVNELRGKRLSVEQVKANFDKTAVHISKQVQKTEKEITQQFKSLHEFLQDEEKARIAALRSEAKLKAKVIREKIVGLSRDLTAFSDTIRAAEDETKAADVLFLQKPHLVLESVQQQLLMKVPHLKSGALIDEAKHLGNLTYNTWMKMKEMVFFSPVVLDPNTAHPELLLSGDLSSITSGQRSELPNNPERFDHRLCVLGSEGFHSGFHSWDVEVRDDALWSVGVVTESFGRKTQTGAGLWALGLDGRYFVVSPGRPDEVLPVKRLQRVRVQLDWDRGKLYFFDLDTEKLIYSFKHTFKEKLFPFMCNKSKLPVKISPVSVSGNINHPTPFSAGFWNF
ncbi:PREDICTED: nuclear factor 7, ovary-like isoform X1 [Cyprinodon variegatus]|uniref:Nuclear factor 7, ovary-like n=1 Tax=Cyprinodon variegatus TaxID=28743 RepID=A0A3Q2CC62_CYPVA|nr:PREDICTED: nuclear factor 7, ovary-like isoform X1 [Cyprinodon variegatus]